MAILNLDYCNNEGGYSDGEIESELLQIVKESDDYNEILKKDDRWPIFYHLSPLRENVFSWYPFKKDASLLEIGSGCGALTGLFCSKVKEVKSIELTKIRGKINYERNKKHTNLELIIGNFNKIPLEEKFDYIILNGVLEYAGSFTETEDPYTDFLKKVKTFLKPNGILLIAIENRFGIKYFNGAVEDHTSRLFSGINNYIGINSVKTFTKGELSELLNDTGFNNFEYYYPVPDYKFPEVLYTDKSLDLMNFNIRNSVYNANRLLLYNEEEVQNTLTKEGIVEHFFNSFIVEVFNGERDIDNDNIIYAKFNNDRKDRFKISTKIIENDKNLKVEKSAMNYKAQRHLEWMMRYYNNQKEIGGFINTPLQKKIMLCSCHLLMVKRLKKYYYLFLRKKKKIF
ncbi:SAM-dependent methyltransferase [Eubacterium limosum]|nr:SAM-dependent methyltransferase [Eubacterium limosum]